MEFNRSKNFWHSFIVAYKKASKNDECVTIHRKDFN